MKRKSKRTILFISFILVGIFIYWWEKVYPLKEFQRLGQFHFPPETSVQSWSESGFELNGKFKILRSNLEMFKSQHTFQPKWNNSNILYSERCINNRLNNVVIEFDPTTLIADVKIATPDFSGEPVCDL